MTRSTGETKFWLKTIGITLAIIAIVVVGTWGVIRLAAEPERKAETQIRTYAPDERAPESFYILHSRIKAYDKQLDQAALDLIAHPGDEFWMLNYITVKKACVDTIARYNTDAHKMTKAKWLDRKLPFEITGEDPGLDCKEEMGSPA